MLRLADAEMQDTDIAMCSNFRDEQTNRVEPAVSPQFPRFSRHLRHFIGLTIEFGSKPSSAEPLFGGQSVSLKKSLCCAYP
jgi:hypothetical protein